MKIHAFVVTQTEVVKPEKFWKENSKFTNQVCWYIQSKIPVGNDLRITENKFNLKQKRSSLHEILSDRNLKT